MNKEQILEKIKILHDSCEEGLDGSWDCSTDEGKESFIDMQDLLKEVKMYIENEGK
jgi:ElaB/YqjD/DUF883 family membrane-anchored ribosome-binding protein